MSEFAFNITDLTIGYAHKRKKQKVLEKINLQIPKGTLTCIVGENGSGKSTLLRSLAGQQSFISGIINVDGKILDQYSPSRWAQKLSWVHTENSLPQGLEVKELVSLGRQPYTNWLDNLSTSDWEQVTKALSFTDIVTLADKKCHELSDGQLQRALISRAIAQDTDIILLDEPTTHLDIHHKINVLSLLKKISKEVKKTILFSSHEIELALQVCDAFICIHKKNVCLLSKKEIIDSDILNAMFKHSSLYFDAQLERFIFK